MFVRQVLVVFFCFFFFLLCCSSLAIVAVEPVEEAARNVELSQEYKLLNNNADHLGKTPKSGDASSVTSVILSQEKEVEGKVIGQLKMESTETKETLLNRQEDGVNKLNRPLTKDEEEAKFFLASEDDEEKKMKLLENPNFFGDGSILASYLNTLFMLLYICCAVVAMVTA